MKVFKYVLLTLAFLSITSCISTGVNFPSFDDLIRAETEQNGRACIRQRDINGYGMLQDDVISVDGRGRNSYYLITTLFRCNSLQTSFAAGFQGSFSELCGGGGDKIITPEEACPIKGIYEFESREAAFATFNKADEIRKDLRAKAKEQAQDKNQNSL
jgi:hypothetical protein